MSAISQDLAKIQSAIYGEEVRGAIHDAIEQCYSDVSNPTLQTEAIEAAIQVKIDEGEMAALTIADGTITGAKFVDGTIPTAKIADGAITMAKLSDDIDLDVETDTTLTQSGVPADAKAVGDALADAMTGEALEDGESMKYVLSSKYDDFKIVDGYGYFDAIQLLNFGYGGPTPYITGANNIIFRMGYGNRSWLSPNYLTDGLFSPDFPLEDIPWAGPWATADASFMGSLPEGFYITIPDNPVRRGSRFVAVPKTLYGVSASFGEFVASFLDGSIGVKIDTDNLTELDLDEKFLAITTGSGYSTVTIEGTRFYKGQLNTPTTMSEFLGYTDNQVNRYRTFCTFGLPYEYQYAKECMWFASGFNQSRIYYQVKADEVDGGNTAVNIVDYLINKRHLKFYYMQEVTE